STPMPISGLGRYPPLATILLIHAYRQETQRWQRILGGSGFTNVIVAAKRQEALAALAQPCKTIILDVSAVDMLGEKWNEFWLKPVPPVILTGESSTALAPYSHLPVAARLTWQEVRQNMAQWLHLTLQLYEARHGSSPPLLM